MTTRVLIFDIGGTVFDWNTAICEVLEKIVPPELRAGFDIRSFSLDCRERYLTLSGAVVRGEQAWMTADEMLAKVTGDLCIERGLSNLPAENMRRLATAWRNMPAWPGAREAIAALRGTFIVAPLTILSWSMAVGSSRRNGIDWDGILSCDVLGVYKPDPRCYARAAEIVDCHPGDIMMVAAHPSDLRAAITAGYRSAYVMPRLADPGEDYTDTGFASEFDVIAQDFKDLSRQLLG